jgi:hypothetical protein
MDTLFSQRFIKEKTPTGKYTYHFTVAGTGVAIEGATIGPDIPKEKLHDIVWDMPAACQNKDITHPIMTEWLSQCNSFFTKPPPIETCLANVISAVDPTAKAAPLTAEEESQEWILCWQPTKVVIDAPKFILYWAPIDKKENTRINEELIFDTIEPETQAELEEVHFDLNAIGQELPAEKTDNFRSNAINLAQKKDMERVIHAYEKARHAYEKAEQYNERFYKKYGFYAVEDDGSETSSFQSEAWTEC